MLSVTEDFEIKLKIYSLSSALVSVYREFGDFFLHLVSIRLLIYHNELSWLIMLKCQKNISISLVFKTKNQWSFFICTLWLFPSRSVSRHQPCSFNPVKVVADNVCNSSRCFTTSFPIPGILFALRGFGRCLTCVGITCMSW